MYLRAARHTPSLCLDTQREERQLVEEEQKEMEPKVLSARGHQLALLQFRLGLPQEQSGTQARYRARVR